MKIELLGFANEALRKTLVSIAACNVITICFFFFFSNVQKILFTAFQILGLPGCFFFLCKFPIVRQLLLLVPNGCEFN